MSYETEKQTTDVNIKELQPYQNRINVVFSVVSKGEEREVSNRNNPDESNRVSDITVADATSSIILTAWNEDIDLLEENKSFTLNNGFVNVFRDSMRLGKGKYGDFEKIDETLDNLNTETNRSDEVHERRQRRNFDSDRGGNRGGNRGGGNRNRDRW